MQRNLSYDCSITTPTTPSSPGSVGGPSFCLGSPPFRLVISDRIFQSNVYDYDSCSRNNDSMNLSPGRSSFENSGNHFFNASNLSRSNSPIMNESNSNHASDLGSPTFENRSLVDIMVIIKN